MEMKRMGMKGLINASLERLDHLEQEGSCSDSIKDRINTLKIELRFLRTFFVCKKLMLNWHRLRYRYKKIKAAIRRDVGQVILSIGGGEMLLDSNGSLFSVQEKIDLIKLQVHECYRVFNQLCRVRYVEEDILVKYIDYVLENMKDLIRSRVNSLVGVKELINTTERKLIFLRTCLQLADELEGYSDRHEEEAKDAVVNAASFSFRCWINRVDENGDRSLSLLLKHERVDTSVYCGILEVSEPLKSDATVPLLVGFIELLLEQLAELLSSDGNVEIRKKDYFESLSEDLELVRSLLTTTIANLHPDYVMHIGVRLSEVARAIQDLRVGDLNEETMSMDDMRLLPSLGRRKLISFLCMEDMVNDETSSIAPRKDQLEILREDIRLLRTFFVETLFGYHVHQEIKKLQSLMEDMALKACSAQHSFHVNEDKEFLPKEISSLLPDLLEKMKHIKAGLRKICSHAASSNSREIHGQKGTKNSLKKLHELLNQRANIISSFVKPHIEEAAKLWIQNLQNEIQFLISFLDSFEEQWIAIGEQEALEMHITNMANEAKSATEPLSLRDDPFWRAMLKFRSAMEEIELIKKEIERINQKISAEKLSAMREVIVGFEDDALKITEQLLGESKQLNIISIIGMGGLGKTTLTKKLYNHHRIVDYFDVRAWCCISQIFQERQVLLDILDQVVELNEGTCQRMNNADLKDMLRKCLKRQRYLIIIDDIWDIKAWVALRRCFDDDCNGSRIVFTTRLQEIATNVQAYSIPYHLRLFKDDESFELLQKKLFPGRRCPREQEKNLKQIATGCKGLPFAVVLVAGILERRKEEEWEQFAECLSLHAGEDMQDLSMRVSELSYKNLPEHLKPCFLYLGMFPEDKDIMAKKVMWLWDAEGFIRKTGEKSSENIAEDYLMDLISRSLVMVAGRGSSGGVKKFRVHDLLHNFSLAKAKNEKFLFLLDGNDEPFTPLGLKLHQKEGGYVESYNSNSTTFEQYRLCVYSMLDEMEKLSSSFRACSLLHFAPLHLDMTSPYDASFIFSNFKLLNILDLGRLQLKDLDCGIELLVQLRLLIVRIQSNSIPSSIANLGKLETFLVQGLRGEVAIPDTIWSMESLRHMHVDNRASLIWKKSDIKHGISDKLETLSTPVLSYGAISGDIIRSLLKLRKLKCIFTAFWSNFENCNYFPELEFLSRLESLKVFYYAMNVSHGRLSFPLNLKKLTLSSFRLPWSNIATIARLPNLEVLKLLFNAFDGKEWETSDDEFRKLQYLKLEALNIEQWNVSSEDHFPVMKELVVHRCKQLEKIPSIIGDIDTLEMIEVKWCNPSAAKSAKDIEQEQLEYGKLIRS